jgi:hypothetical protein
MDSERLRCHQARHGFSALPDDVVIAKALHQLCTAHLILKFNSASGRNGLARPARIGECASYNVWQQPHAFHIGCLHEWPIASYFPAERRNHFARHAGRDPAEYSEQNPGPLIQVRGPKPREQHNSG